jgi:hypothetical protein
VSKKKEMQMAGGPSGERCDGCYYWEFCQGLTEDHGDVGCRFGRCHRFPDRYVNDVTENPDDFLNWQQPTKIEYGWCGEWKPKPTPPADQRR